MQRISITNPQNVIDGTAKKYYFKLRNTGGPKGDKGDKGDTGATGPQGPQGNAATVSVGSTTTLPVGYDATVTNSGSIYNAVLNFGIPQGPQGPQGAKGDKGDTGAQGETGPRGPQGERGTNATVYVGTTTTTNPGTQARVYNSGTDSNAVLNFEIPRGDVGPQPELVQTTGTSTTKAMSQNATTVALATKQNTIDSSHKLSADLVDDTSTTNKFVTASEKATWNAKQNALTAGDNITISGDTISTPAIAPEVVAELPETGAEGKLYLTPKNYTRSTATGNPITATVSDGAGSMESFQLDGDTFQQTYTGKNLCNPATFVKGRLDNGVLGYASNTTSLTVEGNSIAYTTNASYRGIVSAYIPVEPNTAYTLSRTITSEITVAASIDAFESDSEAGWIERLLTAAFTTPNNCHYVRIGFQNYASGTATISNIMVEKSASATSFEPYVGGTPSPNPDYPQPIQTVTGEQTVEVVGKNIIDYVTGLIASGGGITNTINSDGTITTVGKPNADYRSIIEYYDLTPYLEDGATYTLSSTLYDRKTAAQVRRTKISDSSVYNYDTLVGARTFTVDKSQYKYRMGILTNTMAQWGDESLTITKGYQLEKSSTGTAFAPYSKHTYPINLGKNLFDNTGWVQGQYSDGVWNGGNTKRATSGFIPITGGTYTMSLNSTDNKTALINLNYFDSAKTWLGNRANLGLELFGYTDRVKTFTLPNNASYLRVTVRPYGGDDKGDNVIQYAPSEKLQVEAGSQATTYASYKTPIELCKLGDYQDYIYKDGDSWKVHKATHTVTLTGEEQWQYPNVGSSASFFQLSDARWELAFGSGTLAPTPGSTVLVNPSYFKSTKFYGIDASDTNMKTYQGIGKKGGFFRISLLNTWGVSTVEQLQTWLGQNNTKVTYVLATATDTVISDTTLIAQLEAIRTALLPNGANTITNTAAGSNLAGDMEIGYYGYNPRNRYDKFIWLDLNSSYEQLNNPDTSSTLSTRSLGTTTEQTTVTRTIETESIGGKTELQTILGDKTEETKTTEPEESDGADER